MSIALQLHRIIPTTKWRRAFEEEEEDEVFRSAFLGILVSALSVVSTLGESHYVFSKSNKLCLIKLSHSPESDRAKGAERGREEYFEMAIGASRT